MKAAKVQRVDVYVRMVGDDDDARRKVPGIDAASTAGMLRDAVGVTDAKLILCGTVLEGENVALVDAMLPPSSVVCRNGVYEACVLMLAKKK